MESLRKADEFRQNKLDIIIPYSKDEYRFTAGHVEDWADGHTVEIMIGDNRYSFQIYGYLADRLNNMERGTRIQFVFKTDNMQILDFKLDNKIRGQNNE